MVSSASVCRMYISSSSLLLPDASDVSAVPEPKGLDWKGLSLAELGQPDMEFCLGESNIMETLEARREEEPMVLCMTVGDESGVD